MDQNKLYSLIAEKIKFERHKRGLSQEEFADLLGISQSKCSRIENSNKDSGINSINNLNHFSEKLNIPITEFFQENNISNVDYYEFLCKIENIPLPTLVINIKKEALHRIESLIVERHEEEARDLLSPIKIPMIINFIDFPALVSTTHIDASFSNVYEREVYEEIRIKTTKPFITRHNFVRGTAAYDEFSVSNYSIGIPSDNKRNILTNDKLDEEYKAKISEPFYFYRILKEYLVLSGIYRTIIEKGMEEIELFINNDGNIAINKMDINSYIAKETYYDLENNDICFLEPFKTEIFSIQDAYELLQELDIELAHGYNVKIESQIGMFVNLLDTLNKDESERVMNKLNNNEYENTIYIKQLIEEWKKENGYE